MNRIDITSELSEEIRKDIDKAEIVIEDGRKFIDIKFNDNLSEENRILSVISISMQLGNNMIIDKGFSRAVNGIEIRIV